MEKELINLLKDILETDNISIESKKEEIEEWDSFANIQIIAELEDKLNIKIPFEEIGEIIQVKDFLKYLN